MKKIAAMLLILSLAASLCACGTAGNSAPESGSAADPATEGTAPSASAAEADSGATGAGEGPLITIWECAWGGENYESTLQKLAAQATEANIAGKGIRVETSMVSWDNYYETFLTAITSGTAPDIGCEASTAPCLYAEMGYALDLRPIYDAWVAEGSPMIDEIGQLAFDFETHQDMLVGIPFAIDGNGVFYNKEVFAQAGITELPTTFEELTAAAALIKENCPGVAPLAVRADHSSQINWLVFANGGCVVDTDYEVRLSDQPVTNMLEMYKSWWDNGYIAAGSAGYSSDDIRSMLMTGEAGVILSGSPAWVADDKREIIGVIPPLRGPDADETTYHNTMSYQAYYALNTTENPEETLDVLKWWLENNTILFTEGGNSTVPLRASQAQEVMGGNPLKMDFYNAYFNNGDIAIPYIYPFTSFEAWMGIIDAEKSAVKPLLNILTGESYEDGVASATAKIKEVLGEYGH